MADSVVNVLFKLKDETSRSLQVIKGNVEAVNESLKETDGQTLEGLSDQLGLVNNQAQQLTANLNDAINAARRASLVFAAQGAALTAPFLLGAKAAATFSVQIAEIGTLVDSARVPNEQLAKSVIALSTEFGEDRANVASALYQAISSGARVGAEANELLRVALLTARGGVTDVRTAVDGLTTVLNAFNLSMAEAEDVADSLFVTVRGGRTTIEELSQALFQAAPLASQLGVSFDELNGLISAVTLQGTPTSVAVTQIRAAMTSLLMDTPLVTDALAEFGGALGAIEELGLAGTLQRVAEFAPDLAALRAGVGSIESLNLVLSVSGDNTERVNAAMEDQADRLGAIAAAAAEVEAAFGTELERAGVRISNTFERLGNTVLPILTVALEGVSELFRRLTILLTDSPIAQGLAKTVFVVGTVITALGLLGAAILTIGKIFAINAAFSLGKRGLAFALANVGKAAKFARLDLAALSVQGRLSATTLTRLGNTAKFAATGFKILGRAIPIVGAVLAAVSIAGLVMADDFDTVAESVADVRAAIDSLNAIEKVTFLTKLSEEADDLKERVDEAEARIEELKKEVAEGGPIALWANFQIAGVQEELTKLKANVAGAVDNEDFFETNIENIDVDALSESEILAIQEKFDGLATSIAAAKTELTALEAVADIEIEPIFRPQNPRARAAGVAPVRNLDAEKEIQEVRDAAVATQERNIKSLERTEKRYDGILKRVAALKAERQDEADKAAAEKAAKEAAEALNKAAANRERLLKSQQELEKAQSQAALDEILDNNAKELQDKEQQFRDQDISATAYYAEVERLAREDNDAQIAFIEEQIAAQEDLKQAAIDTANARAILADPKATGAPKEVLDRIDTDFATATQRLNARAARFRRQLVAELDTIGDEAASAGLAGVVKGVDAIIQQLEIGRQSIAARRSADLLTAQGEAEELIALEGSVNRQLEDTLETLLALKAAGFGGPALEAEIARVKGLMKETTQEVDLFALQLRVAAEGSLTEFFETTLENLDNIGDAFDQLLLNIGASIRKLIAQRLSDKLLDSLFGGDKSVIGGFLGGSGGGQFSGGGYVKAKDGGILKLAGGGGGVRGPGTATSDSIPALLSDGEYVMNAASVRKYGSNMMEAINRRKIDPIDVGRFSITQPRKHRFAGGGKVGPPSAAEVAKGVTEAGGGSLTLAVDDSTANMLMRDVLEREFGRIMRTR